MTRVLTRSDLEALLEPAACLTALRDGFRTAGTVAVPGRRVRTDLPFPGTATALVPGLLPGIDAYTVKVNAKFPGARPALRGVICLHSGTDGELLALLDSATLTAWRTGLAAALGTALLAPAHDVLGVIGAGAQAELTLRGLTGEHRPRRLVVHDTDTGRAAAFAARHGGRVLASARAVAEAAGTVLLATWSRAPLLALADTRPGQHFTSLGADEPGKRELAPDLLDAALLVVDDEELAARMGALAAPGLTRTAADATLTDVLRGTRPGRTSPGERTVYAPVGLPWQDLALTWLAWREAERRGVGAVIDLLG
ncbi:ornithine cyclodeaminase family protein [Streptomyces sp. FXJ1.172]|uniref:ornithine cyclodeaminase family protein n=1 Tax=Streptomyces sp. FXJ1.172 TaxID=710705 RepID=UPI0007CFEE89|nr:ornithine cyclodeaminase family protein [Streptomyces sp. FXJ1.172]WEO94138.1 ornithine cyclodeaminase family protein [Streptomyces sp. FXJ1.172]